MSQDIKKTIAERYRQEASERVNLAYESIVNSKIKGKISESAFTYFVPYFSGELPIDRSNTVIAQWISIAGTPMSEVDVINSKGQVIFTVPPLFDSEGINIVDRRGRNSFADIANNFQNMNVSTPIAANNFLNNSLYGKIEEIITDNKNVTLSQERWQAILSRYTDIKKTDTSTETAKEVADTSDDLDYE